MKPTRVNTAVRKALEAMGLPSRGATLVCGLSGGPDSAALLDALADRARRDGFTLVAAHLDHGLRAASASDAEFCAELCRGLGIRLVAGGSDLRVRGRRERGSLEQRARDARYAFLRGVKQELGAEAIAVAHTRDDQAETFLLRLLRGAGGAGLAAMRPRSGDLIRPLLAVSRDDVLAHLLARGLAWREDETNSDTRFARNRVRHELIPYLERRFNPRLREALARSAELLASEQALLAALAAQQPERDAAGCVTLALDDLRAAPEALARLRVRKALEAAGGLRGVAEVHVRRIVGLARRAGSSGRSVALPGARRAVVDFDRLRIGRLQPPARSFAIPLEVPGRVELPGGLALVAEPIGADSVSEMNGAVGAPRGPLEVRTRRPGDRVRVRGRLLSLKRYLMRERVPAEQRAGLPLVAAGREVLWMPQRALSSAGERYLRLRLEPA